MGVGLHRPDQLPRLAGDHDVTVVDCPLRLDAVQRSVMLCADMVVLPTAPYQLDAWALDGALDVVREARGLRPELVAVLLIARCRSATVLGRRAQSAIEGAGLDILDAQLADRITYPEAIGAGLGPTTYNPTSAAAREVRVLASELERLGGVR